MCNEPPPLSGGPGTLDGVLAWIARNRESWASRGPIRNFGIWERASGRLVGNIEANLGWPSVDGLGAGDANLAYGLAPFGRGKGYATRSVELACRYLADIGIRRAVIRAEPENVASHGVARRAGFVRDGELVTRDGVKMLRWIRVLAGDGASIG